MAGRATEGESRVWIGLLRAQDAEAFLFCRLGLAEVQRNEFQHRWMILRGDDGGADLKGVRRAKRVRLNDALRVTPNEIQGGHF